VINIGLVGAWGVRSECRTRTNGANASASAAESLEGVVRNKKAPTEGAMSGP